MSTIFTENNNEEKFNIEPLVIEIEKVIRNGVKHILKDFIDRYSLLEKTHQHIMKLPSVAYELQQKMEYEDSSDSETFSDKGKQHFISITDLTNNLIKKQMHNVENRLEQIEKTMDSINASLNQKNITNNENLSPLLCAVKKGNIRIINV